MSLIFYEIASKIIHTDNKHTFKIYYSFLNRLLSIQPDLVFRIKGNKFPE